MMSDPATPQDQQGQGQSPMVGQDAMPQDDGGGENSATVTPEEQQAYNAFVGNALNLVYDQKVLPQILQRLKSGANPVASLAQVAVMVIDRVVSSAQQSGKKIDGDIVFQGGQEILSDLAELADKYKIHSYTSKEIEDALYAAVDQYRTILQQKGQLDPAAFQQDIQDLKQADATGQLDEAMPGLRSHFEKMADQEGAQQDQDTEPDVQSGADQSASPAGLLSRGAKR